MNPVQTRLANAHFLYDSDLLETVADEDFDPDTYQAAGTLTGQAQGRGTAWFVSLAGEACVLRHYRRGGLVARLSDDRYCWSGLESSRAWQEWRLLQSMFDEGLPVPCPVAARVLRTGLFYRADIITRMIADTRSLAGCLSEHALDAEHWQGIGAVLRRFHDAGIYHSDLNAHNILINNTDEIFLIDFDKGERRPVSSGQAGGWQQENLERLHRSLLKLQRQSIGFHFEVDQWQDLLAGYDGVLKQTL
jgi:3-deoxy-D-manno-octulosonic acid kinase